MSGNARHEINFHFLVSRNHDEGSLVDVSVFCPSGSLLLCKTSLGNRMLPGPRVSIEIRPLPPANSPSLSLQQGLFGSLSQFD